MTEISYQLNPEASHDAMNRLFAAAWTDHHETDFTPVLSRSLVYICAYHEAQLVGFVNVAWDGGIHAFILDTCVDPDYRRQGIALRLVARAVEASRARGALWLHVDFEPHLEEFYRQCGFGRTAAGLMRLK